MTKLNKIKESPSFVKQTNMFVNVKKRKVNKQTGIIKLLLTLLTQLFSLWTHRNIELFFFSVLNNAYELHGWQSRSRKEKKYFFKLFIIIINDDTHFITGVILCCCHLTANMIEQKKKKCH